MNQANPFSGWPVVIATALLLLPLTLAPLSAEEVEKLSLDECLIWGALVRGTDGIVEETPKQLGTDLVRRLTEAFDYGRFHLLGEHTQPVLAEFESWVVPSEELYMKIDSKGPVEDGLGLHLQLWQRENVLVKTDVILRDHSPVIIAGPMWGRDQLFFIVELRLEEPGEQVASTESGGD